MSNVDYRVRARGNINWRDFSNLRMEISVGQEYHEGEKLVAACKWAKENFDNVTFIVGDTIQRYNYLFDNKNITEQQAYNLAKTEGDKWLERNYQILNDWRFSITRWDDWRNDPEYFNTRLKCNEFYKKSHLFQDAIRESIEAFAFRKEMSKKEYEHFFDLSLKYLLEETTIFSLAYDELRGISAYPGSFLNMWTMFLDKDYEDAPQGLKYGQWVRLSFEKKKSLKQKNIRVA